MLESSFLFELASVSVLLLAGYVEVEGNLYVGVLGNSACAVQAAALRIFFQVALSLEPLPS